MDRLDESSRRARQGQGLDVQKTLDAAESLKLDLEFCGWSDLI